MSRIGGKIAELRDKKGLSQKQLAKKLGVAESFIKEVEIGRKILNESLINKISDILGEEINDVSMVAGDMYDEQETVVSNNKTLDKVEDVWNDAFSSVLKTIPIYGYDMSKSLGTRQMPVISNKVEGHSSEKVLFLRVQDNDMMGFRMAEGDIAFAYLTHEIENNAVCLVECNGERAIRQIKKLDEQKYLLINNGGSLRTETVHKQELKVLARLKYVEIKL